MCGINLLIGISDREQAKSLLMKMNSTMAHRGPDHDGIFVNDLVGMGHRRLSIIDLSEAGNQPMSGFDQRYQIIYNGEIYNYLEVKSEIAKDNSYPFRFGSDTEVILAAYHKWGVNCLDRLNGMFAFAIYDDLKKELFIARDRLGIKPLYYAEIDGKIVFSSEIRSLLACGLIKRKLNQTALVDYLRYQTVHAPHTIVAGVKMLMPGTYLHISNLTAPKVNEQHYWNLQSPSPINSQGKSYKQVCEHVNELLFDAVKCRLIADVPFGAFLSGGIDSSAVVGLMSKASTQTVKTFSVTFDEGEFSEARYARLVADKFQTDHHEIKLSADYFMQELPNALRATDHPSGDGPNTYIVSKVTKNAGITMALSGLGGDELFAGYAIFNRSLKLQNYHWIGSIPLWLRNLVAAILPKIKSGIAGHKLAELLQQPNFDFKNTYPLSRQVLLEDQIENLLKLQVLPPNQVKVILDRLNLDEYASTISKVSAAEISTYMQNVLLRDTDQMSMASALEVRVPFLDYRLVEYLLSLPDNYKYPISPKKLLVDSLEDLLPGEIINRPKMGFTLPWKHWMRNELRSFCESRIESLVLRKVIQADALWSLWKAFLNGDSSVTWSRIWYLVVLEDWLIQNQIEE